MTDRDMAALLRKQGWGTIPPEQYTSDIEASFLEIWHDVEPYTMTYLERGYALYKAVEYICRNRIPGDFVECGVWKGGSSMLIARSLLDFNDTSRSLYLYDTYTGMTEPGLEDVIAWNGRSVSEKWEEDRKGAKDNFSSWAVGKDEVASNMNTTGYPQELITYVAGDVCETLNDKVPECLALLRLDTDWYRSTVKELEVLYPKLISGGVLIVDDYGHFKGARKAVDEYFKASGFFPYLHRSDYTGRVVVKP
jgi:O-methyltransferase